MKNIKKMIQIEIVKYQWMFFTTYSYIWYQNKFLKCYLYQAIISNCISNSINSNIPSIFIFSYFEIDLYKIYIYI